jgi:ribonuclease VapC
MFVDASAIIAILTREPEADALTDLLEEARSPITSAVAIFEAVLGICPKRHASVDEGGQDVREFLGVAGIDTVPISETEADAALAAFARYGKGRGHPAQLNLGDCLLTRWRRPIAPPCCSGATISIRPTSAPPPARSDFASPAAPRFPVGPGWGYG